MQLNSNEPSTESEAFNECSEQDDDQFVDSLLINNDEFYSNQPYFVDENEGPKVPSNFQIHVADNDIPKARLREIFL